MDVLIHQDARRRVLRLDVALVLSILQACPDINMIVVTVDHTAHSDANVHYAEFMALGFVVKTVKSPERTKIFLLSNL